MNELNEVQRCICEVLDCETAELLPEAALENISGWDSMNALRLLAALEAQFGVRLDLRTYAALETVGQLYEMVASEGVLCRTR